ncbi:MAG: hypothetical protein HA490_04875 [Archaeoglobales archaeon]|jgi:hypothetical protein|nr:hypothetical protein [Archaeoglobales archaeon]
MFINSYLDMIGKVLKGEFRLIPALLDPIKVKEMFEMDCETIITAFREGEIGEDIARRNFFLLKSYVVSQLLIHSERLKKLAEEKGIEAEKKICPEDINEIAMMIEEKEKEI